MFPLEFNLFPLCFYFGQESGGRFIGAAFAPGQFSLRWHQFASEGLSQDGLSEFVNMCFGFFIPPFDLIRDSEKGYNTIDNLFLFFERRDLYLFKRKGISI